MSTCSSAPNKPVAIFTKYCTEFCTFLYILKLDEKITEIKYKIRKPCCITDQLFQNLHKTNKKQNIRLYSHTHARARARKHTHNLKYDN